MLRALAKYGDTNNLNLKLIGIDANKTTISFAKQQSKEFDQISFLHQDIFSESFRNLKYDIVLSTLFLHHFDDKKIISLLKFLLKNVKIGIVINDLNRNKIAYYLFKLISFPLKNQMVKNDGLISILRGFKKEDLKYYSKEIGHQHTVNWKWAFRYQWIIQK